MKLFCWLFGHGGREMAGGVDGYWYWRCRRCKAWMDRTGHGLRRVEHVGAWQWGVRWMLIPWKFRWLYCRTAQPQQTIWVEHEWYGGSGRSAAS